MKKEYLILIAVILLLSGYLLFHEENTDNFPLPAIAAITPDQVTGLDITGRDGTIELVKKDKTWQIKAIDRPADNTAVENMLDALRDLKISALVSQSKDVKRYELDPDRQIRVTVKKGEKPVLAFAMGKTAPTFNHTFVMIEEDPNIYHAKGSFRTYFDKSIPELRDKNVMTFTEKAVTSFTIEKDGLSRTFTAVEKENKDQETGITWRSQDQTAVDQTEAADLMSALAFLECDAFLTDEQKQALDTSSPFCRIVVKTDNEHRLTFLKTGEDAPLTGISSMNPDAFTLSKFNGDDIIEKVDTLLGIEKETPEKE